MIRILFRCIVSLKVRTYSFTLKLVFNNLMILKEMISSSMQAIEKSCLINYLTPKKRKEIKIMKAETLFRINLFCLLEEHTDIGTTFYRECRVYYYNLSTDKSLLSAGDALKRKKVQVVH